MLSAKVTVHLVWALLVVGAALFAIVTPAAADTYLNSSEPGCNGSDPNVLMCDDFEDGVWYATDCTIGGGYTSAANDGWCGTIYANPITPANAAICGGMGAAGTNCTATQGVRNRSEGGGNMADHAFLNKQGVDEIYVRFYTRPSSGYFFGAEKVLTFNNSLPGSGGIWFGNLHINCGNAGTTGSVQWQIPGGSSCVNQNQGSTLMLQGNGHWYYIEVHVKLNTAGQNNGTFRMWMNDCGTNGVCTGTPTLRTSRTDIKFRHSSNTEMITTLWWENWANPGSGGERFIDQIKASKVGPIGFVGGTPPPTGGVAPSSPTNLTVR